MTRLEWGQGNRPYEYGIDRGVLYIENVGLPWEGLISAEESPGDSSTSSYYFDGVKMIDLVSGEDFDLHVAAYMYPEEFEDYKSRFNFTYRTLKSVGYKIHLVYNVTAMPVGRFWSTNTEAINISDAEWNFVTVPTKVPNAKPTAHLIVDSVLADPESLSDLEDLLYGSDDNEPTFPTAEEVIDIFSEHAIFVVVLNGDGSWTATGPDDWFEFPDSTSFEITSPSVIYLDSETYNISSY